MKKMILKFTFAVVAVVVSSIGAWKAYGAYEKKPFDRNGLLEENIVAFSEVPTYTFYLCASNFDYDYYTESTELAALCPNGTKYYKTRKEANDAASMVQCESRKMERFNILSDYAFCYIK